MITFSIICQSKHWPARKKKVNWILDKILTYNKELGFKVNIDYNCNVVLSDNKLIKKINYKFRKTNKPTDVLTFISEIKNNEKNKTKICDILLSAEIIKKDSYISKISFYDHLCHILIHSFLHINGFKHNTLKDFKKMKKIEIKILKKLEINNPYLYNL